MCDRKLVGLVGLARSGKNSASKYMCFKHGFEFEAAFADPLKRAAMAIFGLSHDEVQGVNYDRESPHPFWGISVREMLQKLGTESVRKVFGEDHWVSLMDRRLSTGDLSHLDVVITDLRFENEVELIRKHRGHILGLVRTGCDVPEVRPHVSEEMAAYRLDEVCDHVVYARDLSELGAGIDRAMEGVIRVSS